VVPFDPPVAPPAPVGKPLVPPEPFAPLVPPGPPEHVVFAQLPPLAQATPQVLPAPPESGDGGVLSDEPSSLHPTAVTAAETKKTKPIR
jgi:hypothetical protein